MDTTDRLADFATSYSNLIHRAATLAVKLQSKKLGSATESDFSVSDIGTIQKAFLSSAIELAHRPDRIFAFQAELWMNATQAWVDAWSGTRRDVSDRRFRGRAWDADPITRGLRDSQIACETAVSNLLSQLPKGSKDHLRTEFYTRQMLSALSPSNVLALNPVARERFIETQGQSLLDGFRNLLDDLEEGDGRIDIATNDKDAFRVGRDLATTTGKVIFQNPLMQLIQYEPTTKQQFTRPIIYVPAWINKFYILDMRPENSLVRYMLDRGHSVFVISWVNPTEEHASFSFEDYMKLGPLAALDIVEATTGAEVSNILGFCIGGILVNSTLAYLAAKGEGHRIGAATTLATMVDFTNVGEIGVFIDRDRLKALREHMEKTGYLEKHHLQEMFSMIRENDLVWSFHVMNYLMGRKPPAFDLLFWNSDATRLPAEMLLWYLEKVYIENGLKAGGSIQLDGFAIDLSAIKTPLYVLATREDHIAPWTSVYPTTEVVGDNVTFVLGGSGHIAGVINAPGERVKYGYWTSDEYPPSAEEWLKGAKETPGSWWPHWASWLEAMDQAPKVPARRIETGPFEAIEDAPGSYVLAR